MRARGEAKGCEEASGVALAAPATAAAAAFNRCSAGFGSRGSGRRRELRQPETGEAVLGLADHCHGGDHGHHVALFIRTQVDDAFGVGFYGEDCLVGLNFQDGLTLLDALAVLDQPVDDGHLFDGLAQLGDEELHCHQLTTFLQACKMRPTLGIAMSSSTSARGTGTLAAATRCMGASSQSKASSLICAITSLMKLVFS